MQKVMLSLWKPSGLCSESWRQALLEQCQLLTDQGAQQLRLMVVDAAVAPAHTQRMTASAQPLDGMLSVHIDIARQLAQVQTALAPHTASVHAYHVCETTPNTEQRQLRQAQWGLDTPAAQGSQPVRAPGMCQVALFQRPRHLTTAQWLHAWRDHHSFNAYALQSIYDCRQNLVVQRLSADAPEVHAIVEEHYPTCAIGCAEGYYGTLDQPQLLYERTQALSDSVCGFVDLHSLDSVLTSFYQVSAPH